MADSEGRSGSHDDVRGRSTSLGGAGPDQSVFRDKQSFKVAVVWLRSTRDPFCLGVNSGVLESSNWPEKDFRPTGLLKIPPPPA